MRPIDVTRENFEQEVMHSTEPVLLDFWASWCGPCRALSPIIEEIAAENPGIKVCKVNIDAEPELTERFRVMSVPSLFAIQDGETVGRTTGTQPKSQIMALFE